MPFLGPWVRGYFDDRNFYSCDLITNDVESETKGMQITKLDMNTGMKVNDWFLPFKYQIMGISDASQPSTFAMDEKSLYMTVNLDNNTFILKSSKDGTDYKLIPIGGNISADIILKIGISGDQILVFGYGSVNRNKEQLLYMYRINKNGEFIDHE